MTARICAFSRAYHSMHNEVKIFDDPIAKKLLSQEEYAVISENMSNGIQYFNKGFVGNKNEEMHACYSYEEMEAILEKYNMQIFEHLDSEQMTSQYFSEYNSANSSYEMKAQSNVNYCLCVKK